MPRYRLLLLLSILMFGLPSAAICRPDYHAVMSTTVDGPVVVSIPFMGGRKAVDGRSTLKVTATFPKSRGAYPLIVFSHGYGGAPNGYQHLIDYWAAHGYVVLAPTHADAGALTRPGAIETMSEKLTDPAACRQRVEDVETVIDEIPLIEQKLPALRGRIDTSRIAVAGHSFGAYVTQLLGGATVDFGSKTESFADSRLSCVLMLSPQGANKMGLTARSWDHMMGPAMTMTGSLDYPFAQKGGPATRLDPFNNAPAGHKYLVYINGANHFTFCDIESNQEARHPLLLRVHERRGLSQTEMYEYVKAASTAFFDAYLKGNANAVSYLSSGRMSESSGGSVHVDAK